MRLPLLLSVLVIVILAPAGSVLARGDDDDDRDRRIEEIEKRLKGKTPQEQEELRKRLARLREKTEKEREELRRKHEKSRAIAQHLARELPADLRDKLDRLPEARRKDVLHHAVCRMLAIMRDQLSASLTGEERARIEKLEGPDRYKAIYEIKRQRLLEKLAPEQRNRVDALPDPERIEWVRNMMRRAYEEERRMVRERVTEEIRLLLDAPPEEMDKILRAPWVRLQLERLGFEDRELTKLVLDLPEPDIYHALGELGRIRDIEDKKERRKALAAFKAGLAE